MLEAESILVADGEINRPMSTQENTPLCLFCAAPLRITVVDLGMSPLCESYVSADHVNHMEPFYPLHVYVCEKCFLVQLEQYVSADQISPRLGFVYKPTDTTTLHAGYARYFTPPPVENVGRAPVTACTASLTAVDSAPGAV